MWGRAGGPAVPCCVVLCHAVPACAVHSGGHRMVSGSLSPNTAQFVLYVSYCRTHLPLVAAPSSAPRRWPPLSSPRAAPSRCRGRRCPLGPARQSAPSCSCRCAVLACSRAGPGAMSRLWPLPACAPHSPHSPLACCSFPLHHAAARGAAGGAGGGGMQPAPHGLAGRPGRPLCQARRACARPACIELVLWPSQTVKAAATPASGQAEASPPPSGAGCGCGRRASFARLSSRAR